MKNKKNKQRPYSKIIDFDLEQDLYAVLCLHSTRQIKKRLKKQRTYHYYIEWKNHIEKDVLALFNTQIEINEFARYCKLQHNTAKLFKDNFMPLLSILISALLPLLTQYWVNLGANLLIIMYALEICILFGFWVIIKDVKLDQIENKFWADVADISENHTIRTSTTKM